MAFDHIATTGLWDAVRQDDPAKIRALVHRGGNVLAQGQMRVMDNRGRTGKDSLMDVAIEHRSLHALEALLDLGVPFHPTKERGSEFTRACAQAKPWMEGLTKMWAKRPSLQAISHRDKEGYGAIHDALSYTSAEDEQDCSPLVQLLLTRSGKWIPKDTGLAIGVCMSKGYQTSILNRLEEAGVPVSEHLADTQGAQAMWNQVSVQTFGLERWREWLDALMARQACMPTGSSDPQFLAMIREAKTRNQTGAAELPQGRSRLRP